MWNATNQEPCAALGHGTTPQIIGLDTRATKCIDEFNDTNFMLWISHILTVLDSEFGAHPRHFKFVAFAGSSVFGA
jgi:hypothetical protein